MSTSKVRIIQKKRVYAEDFKRELVNLFERGKYSVVQLEKLYGVSESVIYRWIYRYSGFNQKGIRIVEMKQSSTVKLKELERRVQELEQMVGQKQVKIEFLEKMIELTEQDLKIDIKKNGSTPPSNGTGKTGKQ